MTRETMSVRTAAEKLHTSQAWIRELLARGELLGAKIDGRWVIISDSVQERLTAPAHPLVQATETNRLADEIARLTGWPAPDLQRAAKALRDLRMLPEATRANEPPPIAAQQAATLLVTMAATDRVSRVAELAPQYARLEAQAPDHFAPRKTFAEAITEVVSDLHLARLVTRVTVCRSWPEATITYRERKDGPELTQRYHAPDMAPPRTTAARTDVTIPRAVFHQLAERIRSANETAEWGSE